MAKRIAEKELTDRNWDLEDEGEEVSRCEHEVYVGVLVLQKGISVEIKAAKRVMFSVWFV